MVHMTEGLGTVLFCSVRHNIS